LVRLPIRFGAEKIDSRGCKSLPYIVSDFLISGPASLKRPTLGVATRMLVGFARHWENNAEVDGVREATLVYGNVTIFSCRHYRFEPDIPAPRRQKSGMIREKSGMIREKSGMIRE
jgi:hypothetical protein